MTSVDQLLLRPLNLKDLEVYFLKLEKNKEKQGKKTSLKPSENLV